MNKRFWIEFNLINSKTEMHLFILKKNWIEWHDVQIYL